MMYIGLFQRQIVSAGNRFPRLTGQRVPFAIGPNLRVGLIFAFVLLSMVCSQGAAGLQPVRLQLKWHHQFQFAGYYAAIQQGYYRKAGLDVKIVEADERISPVDAVMKGESEFGICNTELLRYRAEGVPVVALAVIFQHSPVVLACRADRGIHRVKDLAGRRISIEPEPAEQQALLMLHGIKAGQFVDVSAAETRDFTGDGLIQGRLDAMAAYVTDEPFSLSNAQVNAVFFSAREAGIDFYSDILFTTEKMVNERPEVVRAFREASIKGWQYALAHKEEIIQLILDQYSQRHSRAHLEFEAHQIQLLMEPDVVEIGYMSQSRWRAIANTYQGLGYLPGPVNIDRFLNTPPTYEAQAARYLRDALFMSGLAGVALILGLRYFYIARRLRQESRRLEEDLSIRKQKDEQIRKLLRAVECSSASIVITDRSGRIDYANPKFSVLSGYNLAELLGKNPRLLQSGEMPVELYRNLWATIFSGREWHGEFHNRKKNGELYWELASIAPVFNDEGQITHFVAVKEDITERKRAEQAIREKKAELREANRKLQLSLAEVKELSGLLPICAWCKKIRDGAEYWLRVEDYLSRNTKAKFTHSICPDCYQKCMADLEKDKGLRA